MLRLLRVLGSRRPRGRALLSVIGIALGVALGYGVYPVNRAAVDELAAAVRGLRVIGIAALRERRPELLAPDKVLLSAAAAEVVKGDRLRLMIGQRTIELQVGGVLDIKGVEALTDIATAQWRLERLDRKSTR